MSKATEVLQQLEEELNEYGLSSFDGIYTNYYFPIHHNDIDLVPTRPVKMDVKQALWVTNQMKNTRVCVLEGVAPVQSRTFLKRNGMMDIHINCSSVNILEELPDIIAESKVILEKYSRDLGFTPGMHYYNLVDCWAPWESVRVLNSENNEEGWI
jgi:hypothetical protein